MNFELQTLFKFQQILTEMQGVCIGIQDKAIREAAIKRVDSLMEIYKTFEKFYYSAHFHQQKAAHLQFQVVELSRKINELQEENAKLLKSLEWPA